MTTEAIDLDSVILETGAHDSPSDGMCVMEMVSYIAREPWSDHPSCVSPVLGAFLRSWNDGLNDDDRQMLKPYAAKVIGTANDGRDEERAWMCADWLIRTHLPTWSDLAGIREHASTLRALTPITSTENVMNAQAALAAARAAAWAAARAAALDAAREAARAAAGYAAWEKLRPTLRILQASATGLLDRLIAV